MKINGRWLGGVGLLVVACAGTRLTEVGELNDGNGGSGAEAGSKDGKGAAGGIDGKGAAGGIDGGGGTPGDDGGVPPIPHAGSGNFPQGGKTTINDGIAGAGADDSGPVGGNSPYSEPDNEPDPVGSVVYEASSTIFAVAADATTLYWVEYGTTDELGNYNNDGRLVARDFDSSEVRVVANELPGAVGVALTSEHAYVSVDQYYDDGPRNALMRVALTGGTPEAVLVRTNDQDYASSVVCETCFVNDDDTGYFLYEDKVYRITPTASVAEVFTDIAGDSLAAGDESLYVANSSNANGVWTIPYATGIADRLTTQPRGNIVISGDDLYGVENANVSVYLSRMPLSGGSWVRLAPKRTNAYSWALQELDGLFFQELTHGNGPWQVLQGRLDDVAGAAIALDLPSPERTRIWIGTHEGIFWNDGRRLRQSPLVVE